MTTATKPTIVKLSEFGVVRNGLDLKLNIETEKGDIIPVPAKDSYGLKVLVNLYQRLPNMFESVCDNSWSVPLIEALSISYKQCYHIVESGFNSAYYLFETLRDRKQAHPFNYYEENGEVYFNGFINSSFCHYDGWEPVRNDVQAQIKEILDSLGINFVFVETSGDTLLLRWVDYDNPKFRGVVFTFDDYTCEQPTFYIAAPKARHKEILDGYKKLWNAVRSHRLDTAVAA